MNDQTDLANALSTLTRHLLIEGAHGSDVSQPKEPWLSIERAAIHADVSPDTVRNWISAGQLKAGRMGRVVRLRASDIDAMLLKDVIKNAQPQTKSRPGKKATRRSAQILDTI